MFVDEIEILVRGGKGGDGCMCFRREKYVDRGGPDGGDGGDGGSVLLTASPHENTLHHLSGRVCFEAEKGQPGGPRNKAGRGGQDLEVEVPVGTVVLDAAHGNVLRDLGRPGERFAVVRGGRGGRGNARFASSTNRAPRHWESGREGEERRVRLSLKLIADVGLLGLPNAGKSTLLSALTRARPRIADYPFTTLEPHLGIVEADRSFVMADIPGLIVGAHGGRGLGDKFLKHIERTRILLHLVDCGDGANEEPAKAFEIVRNEVANYSQTLAARPSLLVATKVEDEAAEQRAAALADATGRPVHTISAVTRAGLPELLGAILPLLSGNPDPAREA